MGMRRYSNPMPSFQIFTPEEIASVRRGGKILRACLEHVSALVKPGIKTIQLDQAAEEFIRSHMDAEPAFYGYHGYPSTLCTSVNEECVHGLPGDKVLKEGDIISIDCGVLYDGLYTDACVSVPVGRISQQAQRLLNSTQKALDVAVALIAAGVRTGDLSSAIQRSVEDDGFTIVRPLTGHGLGKNLHQFPDIPNFGKAGTGPVLPANTVIAIEPIVSVSSKEIRELSDRWTIVTADGSLSAHYEHTILVLDEGCEVLA